MSIKINTSDLNKTLSKLKRNIEEIDYNEVRKATILRIGSIARSNYLRGPRPGKLGVVTGRLRNSIGVGSNGINKLKKIKNGAQITIGTNLVYAARHEYGFEKNGIMITPARPYLAPALEEFKNKDLKRIKQKFFRGII